MFRSLKTSRSKRQCVQLLCILAGWPVLSFSLSFLITPSAHAAAGQEQAALQSESAGADARHGPPTPRGYRIINVVDGANYRATNFNARDQIGVSFYTGNFNPDQVFFLDGKSIRDIGNFGGNGAWVTGINDAGELAGSINTDGDAIVVAYKWNARDGLAPLFGILSNGSYAGQTQPINNRGQVVGSSGIEQAVLWSPGEPVRLLDGLPGNQYGFSTADAINSTGMIAGQGRVADGTTQAFAWTRKSGYIDVSPAGAAFSSAVGVNDDKLIVGNARDANGKLFGFSWTHKAGARKLATGRFAESTVNGAALLARGNVAGSVRSGEITHAAVWIGGAPDALVDLGTFGGPSSLATAVNNHAHVVGVADYTAGKRASFIWTRKEGKIDLNTRLRHAPPGLTVTYPYAISDRGTILADTSAGLVLLKPEEDCADVQAPTVGAIDAADMVEVGAMFDVSVGFAGPAVGAALASAASHDVKWSFGDGKQGQPGSVRASRGAGQAGASHRYTAPGIYTVSAQVNGRSGPGPTVSRTIVAYDRASGSMAGNGWFSSPPGADRTQSLQGDRSHFTFAGTGVDGKPGALHFKVGTLDFRSNAVTAMQLGGGEARLDGTGKLNGAGNYRFSLRASGSENGKNPASSRIGLKIWHTDQATNAEVIDYDNLGTGAGSVVPAAQGEIVSQ